MKRNIFYFFAIGCVCAVSALLFQSCVREEDYEQAIIGDWELEKYTSEYGDKHYTGWWIEEYTGNYWDVRITDDHREEVSGPHKIVLDDFEKTCMISFKSDGQFVYSSGTDITNGDGLKWTVIGSAIKLERDVSWNCEICRYKDNSYQVDREINVGTYGGYYNGYVDTTIVGYHSEYTRFGVDRDYGITIESLTRNRLIIKVENEYWSDQPDRRWVQTFKFKKA